MVPVSVNAPVALSPPLKHGFDELKVRFVTVTPALPVDFSVVVKLSVGFPLLEFDSAADQFPLIASALLLLVPQPSPIMAKINATPINTFFIVITPPDGMQTRPPL